MTFEIDPYRLFRTYLQQFKGFPLLLLMGLTTTSGCYSFKGISIPEDAKTFYVAKFEDISDLQLPNYDITFTELLKDKIRNESRLKWAETDPDIEFKGKIIGFTVSSVAPEAGSVSAFNRLEVTIEVSYTNLKDESKNWTKRFSQFDNFDSQLNLLEATDDILPGINQLLLDYIFNAAFTDW
jgi:hypothetical protein